MTAEIPKATPVQSSKAISRATRSLGKPWMPSRKPAIAAKETKLVESPRTLQPRIARPRTNTPRKTVGKEGMGQERPRSPFMSISEDQRSKIRSGLPAIRSSPFRRRDQISQGKSRGIGDALFLRAPFTQIDPCDLSARNLLLADMHFRFPFPTQAASHFAYFAVIRISINSCPPVPTCRDSWFPEDHATRTTSIL
jgi:hypothetical protein